MPICAVDGIPTDPLTSTVRAIATTIPGSKQDVRANLFKRRNNAIERMIGIV